MLKYLILTVLISLVLNYLRVKLRRYIFNFFGFPQFNNSTQKPQSRTKVKKEGEIEIEYISEEELTRRRKSQNFKDGDYIDFEEIK